MLIHLQQSVTPHSLHEASEVLKQSGVYPLYGGGAALIRANLRDVHTAVDLRGLVSAECRVDGNNLYLGAAASLESIAAFRPAFGALLRAELPITLRHALTLGDLLLEAPSDSLFLTMLYGAGARIDTPARGADDLIEFGRWFTLDPQERAQHLVQGVALPYFANTPWRFAFAKVARTPADRPIVAAVGFAYAGEPDPGSFAVVCGLAPQPVRYSPGMTSQIGDYRGSAEYRAAMAQTLVAQALEAAEAEARRSAGG